MLPSYITEKYAGILTKEDISQLFNGLTKKLGGNRSEAARQCYLTGKATYDWEKAKYVKLATKEKVLEASLKMDFLNTIEYLFVRSNDRTVDILRTILLTIYNEAGETDSKEHFKTSLVRFYSIYKKHRGLINDNIKDEVAEMVWSINQRAPEFGISPPEKSIEDVSLREWLDAFPVMVDAYLNNPQEARKVAMMLDLPTKPIEIIWSSFEKLRPIELTTQTEGFYAKCRETREMERWAIPTTWAGASRYKIEKSLTMWAWAGVGDKTVASEEETFAHLLNQKFPRKEPTYPSQTAE